MFSPQLVGARTGKSGQTNQPTALSSLCILAMGWRLHLDLQGADPGVLRGFRFSGFHLIFRYRFRTGDQLHLATGLFDFLLSRPGKPMGDHAERFSNLPIAQDFQDVIRAFDESFFPEDFRGNLLMGLEDFV